jgi:thiol-disulfide isomerase/thioredoxin
MRSCTNPARTFLILFMVCLTAQGEIRKWTSTAGTTIDAEFVQEKLGTVYLKTADGAIKKIPTTKLIKDDRLLVAKLNSPFTNKARATAEEDPEAPKAIYELFGKELRNSRKEKLPVDALAGKTIGIFFSAHWCPPCKAFTPKLVEFHNEMTRQNKPFQIVFVSADHDKSSMYNYMKELDMPWLALPFADDHGLELKQKYNVAGIPKLVIINEKAELITENGRRDVTNKGAEAFDSWRPN